MCVQATGLCSCIAGYFGAACDGECPRGGATNAVCSGVGSCEPSGKCQCNIGYNGTACATAVCPSCSSHGRCQGNVCVCQGGYTDPFCNTPPPASADHGVLSFTSAEFGTSEAVGSVQVTLQRRQGTQGTVTAFVSSHSGTAVSEVDFFPLNNVTVTWADGDGAPKNISVLIIQDASEEGPEAFSVTIDSVGGLGLMEMPCRATIKIAESVTPSELAQISIRILTPFVAAQVPTLSETFRVQLRSALGIQGPGHHVNVQSIASASATSSAPANSAVAVTFLLFADPESDQSVRKLVDKFFKQGFLLLPQGGILKDYDLLAQIDYTQSPVVLLRASDPAGDDGQPRSKAWVVGLVVGLVLLACCLFAGVFGYRRRVQLSEWLMYKLGSFRFQKFKATEVPTDERDNEDEAAGGLSPLEDDGPMGGRSSDRDRGVSRMELVDRREEKEAAQGVLLEE